MENWDFKLKPISPFSYFVNRPSHMLLPLFLFPLFIILFIRNIIVSTIVLILECNIVSDIR